MFRMKGDCPMRKIFKQLVVCLLITCCITTNVVSGFASVPSDVIEPLYELTYKTRVSLSLSSAGNAVCSCYVKAATTTSSVSITVSLCRKEGSSWIPVISWTEQDQVYAAYVDQSCNVSAGTYRLQMTGKVVATDGSVETVSGVSAEKTCN